MSRRNRQNGVALLEAMIAVVILAFGVLGAVGLQARATAAMSNAGARADAAIAAEKLVGLMWTDQANLANYAYAGTGGGAPAAIANWVQETQALLPNATFNIAVTAPVAPSTASRVTVSIGWTRRSGEGANVHTITATLAPT